MSASSSPTSIPESESALDKLQREADEDSDNDFDDLVLHHRDSGAKLQAWRKAEENQLSTPKSQMAWDDMHAMFPSIPRDDNDDAADHRMQQDAQLSALTPSKPRPNRWKTHQLRQTKRKRAQNQTHALSDLGFFGLLPGELRNAIYRLAFVPPADEQPVLITGSELICGRGACVHSRAAVAAPGMASTCRQIRVEILPLFAGENAFRFDAAMVRNRCVGAWVKGLDSYARIIGKVTLEVLVLRRNALGTESQVGEIGIECPAARTDGRFELVFSADVPRGKIEGSKLVELVERLNENGVGEGGRASKLAFLVGSDELAEMVFRCKK
ncbi:hypothetical protein B0A55_07016 [Friedmanniomyces simplex]|uniref:Uncharacterized protein n=1 Tax=Friedmanniomyces simplex TaxID=329884 RepID=A0A4U0X316_9PEZI|nr:hypothetical protein B0A55_07016 [Friedmanniomyces simplex]